MLRLNLRAPSPRYFESYNELEDWVEDHTPIAYSAYNLFDKNLELQEQALADGYIWSAFYDYDATVIGEAVAGDSIYWIWLDGEIQWIAYR